MKFLVVILLITLAFTKGYERSQIPITAPAHFVHGFLKGALAKEVSKVEHCLTDGDKIIEDVEAIINNIEKGFNLLELIKELGALLTHIPDSIQDCKELPTTIKATFTEWVNKIKNPVTIALIVYKALSEYATRLKDDAIDFVKQFKGGEYETSGLKLGDIPHVLFDLCSSGTEETVKILLEKN